MVSRALTADNLEGAFAWADRVDTEETARGYAEIRASKATVAGKAVAR